MSGLKQLKNRVKSIKSTQKITNAMYVVSASKLKKLKDQAENLNEYSMVLASIMNEISIGSNVLDLPENDRRFFSKHLTKMTHLLVVMTSERGLCGGFNSSVVRSVKKSISQLQQEGREVKLLVIGKKGYDALKGEYSDIIEEYYHNTKGDIECLSRQVKNKIIQLVESEQVGACYMYYNRFKNVITQILTKERILPVEVRENSEIITCSEYEYEGSSLAHDVINLYISGEINYGLLQTRASAEGARMAAMDNATRNAGELVDKLTLKLNRTRQAIITTELTEIISGAESI